MSDVRQLLRQGENTSHREFGGTGNGCRGEDEPSIDRVPLPLTHVASSPSDARRRVHSLESFRSSTRTREASHMR